ncbi:hypothetical protein Mapa_016498 [Marchantia paleacea]|nr:hypothetical protein Mapa_016498 [Marchantia paleacea]
MLRPTAVGLSALYTDACNKHQRFLAHAHAFIVEEQCAHGSRVKSSKTVQKVTIC